MQRFFFLLLYFHIDSAAATSVVLVQAFVFVAGSGVVADAPVDHRRGVVVILRFVARSNIK